EVGPAALPQQLDDVPAPAGVPAGCAAERLAKGAGEDVDSPDDAACLVRAATVRTHEADRMRIVDHHEGPVPLAELADRAEVRNDSVHREHAVRRDELEARGRRVLQLALE